GVGFFREWDTERRLKKARQALPLESIPVEERRRRKLVRRSHALTIAAAWVVTVPAAAILSAIRFALLNQLPVGNSEFSDLKRVAFIIFTQYALSFRACLYPKTGSRFWETCFRLRREL